ncbi:hypothetical protein C0992_005085 [Termitomyces sp. T32_za158]|nr:hypothetical protein C0992_005085 [Termitomyces sp. T32_za158]
MATTQDHTTQSDIGKMKTEADGSYKRADASFRNTIEKGGRFEPELGTNDSSPPVLWYTYILTPSPPQIAITSTSPWATRTLIMRKLKGLEDIIPVTVVSPRMGAQGWPFASVDAFPDADVDPLYQAEHVKDLYLKADPGYNGRFTVPVLWDKKTHTIVNNESSEIIRIFNTAFNHVVPPGKAAVDYYPTNLRSEIDALNAWIYPNINNGVYRAGFATTQEAYQKAVVEVFEALGRVEKILAGKDFLVGNTLTEADIRLWVTIVRFFFFLLGQSPGVLMWTCVLFRSASIRSTSATSSATCTQSVTGTLPSTSASFFHPVSDPEMTSAARLFSAISFAF